MDLNQFKWRVEAEHEFLGHIYQRNNLICFDLLKEEAEEIVNQHNQIIDEIWARYSS